MNLKLTALGVLATLVMSCNDQRQPKDATSEETYKLERNPENQDQVTGDDKFQQDSIGKTPQGTDEPAPSPGPGQPIKRQAVDWDKKIIRTATLNTVVKDYKNYSLALHQKIRTYGGYVSNEEQTQSEYKIENTVTIKVPVDQFENLMNELVADALQVNEKKVASQDVTTELIDGRSRLEAKKQVRLRYLDLLKQAKNMEEIINVQREINSIQEDIELVSGRISSLNQLSAMSTITLTYAQILDAKASIPESTGFSDKLSAAFINGGRWMGEVLIGLISIWPLLIGICFLIFVLRKKQVFKNK